MAANHEQKARRLLRMVKLVEAKNHQEKCQSAVDKAERGSVAHYKAGAALERAKADTKREARAMRRRKAD